MSRNDMDMDSRTAVKICGLTNLEDARFASGAGADFLGFIFFEGSPRYIDPPKAGAIINWIHGPEAVGVFVNQPPDNVNLIARQTGIDLVQLHGTESPGFCRLVEKPVIKVFHIEEETSAAQLEESVEPYLDSVEYLLFDTKIRNLWGGTGKVFNWDILKYVSHDKPVFLSGGLTPGNIRDACRVTKPFAVDLSSGLEQAPGIKDFDKVGRLFEVMDRIHSGEES